MTFRGDDDALRARMADATRRRDDAKRERERLKDELATLERRRTALDAAIAERRGSALGSVGWLRTAALMVAMMAFGALDQWIVDHVGRIVGFGLLGTVGCGFIWTVHRHEKRKKEIAKLLEAHDARMAAERAAARVEEEEAEEAGDPMAEPDATESRPRAEPRS